MSNTRVRKPPGGESTFNIFGVPNEPKTTQKTDNTQKATVVVEAQELQAKTDDTFTKEDKSEEKPNGSEENDEKTNDEEEQQKENDEKTNGEEQQKENDEKTNGEEKQTENAVQNSGETTAPLPSSSSSSSDTKKSSEKSLSNEENQNTSQGAKNKQRAGYNPITGQPYNTAEKTEASKATCPARVRQPPGGASSKLW